MQMAQPFPENRINDPKRRAELAVYEEIANSPVSGLTVYGSKVGPDSPEIDFALWISDVGRFTNEVKGGCYTLEAGKWKLITTDGPQPVSSPVLQARDSAMCIRDTIKQHCNKRRYILACLTFTDMNPDPAILEDAAKFNVHVKFGVSGLVEEMQRVASEQIYGVPTAMHIQGEAQLLVPGIQYQEAPRQEAPSLSRPNEAPAPSPDLNMTAPHVTIHAGVVNIYTAGGGMDLSRQ